MEVLYEPVKKNEDTVELILDGESYYDVEFEEDRWVRIELQKGDLIVIPKGNCYRKTTTPKVISNKN